MGHAPLLFYSTKNAEAEYKTYAVCVRVEVRVGNRRRTQPKWQVVKARYAQVFRT
jgi:hypothetical protein